LVERLRTAVGDGEKPFDMRLKRALRLLLGPVSKRSGVFTRCIEVQMKLSSNYSSAVVIRGGLRVIFLLAKSQKSHYLKFRAILRFQWWIQVKCNPYEVNNNWIPKLMLTNKSARLNAERER